MEFPICIGSESGSQFWHAYNSNWSCPVTTPHDHTQNSPKFWTWEVGMPALGFCKERLFASVVTIRTVQSHQREYQTYWSRSWTAWEPATWNRRDATVHIYKRWKKKVQIWMENSIFASAVVVMMLALWGWYTRFGDFFSVDGTCTCINAALVGFVCFNTATSPIVQLVNSWSKKVKAYHQHWKCPKPCVKTHNADMMTSTACRGH